MKTKMKTTTTSLAAALLTTVACAGQDRPQGPPPHPPMPLFEALDADGDRMISAAEIEAAAPALKNLDGDGDGTITREELRSKAGWSPYEGRRITGRTTNTFLRGQLVTEPGSVADAGMGRFVPGAGAR